jgi:hypothetical protein
MSTLSGSPLATQGTFLDLFDFRAMPFPRRLPPTQYPLNYLQKSMNKTAASLKPSAQTNLGLALAAYQQKYDVQNGVMAKEIGIAGPTLSKIKAGTMPDGKSLLKILAWLSRSRSDRRQSI